MPIINSTPFKHSSAVITGYSQTVIADNPQVYWRLNDSSGSTVAAESPTTVSGTYFNTPTLNRTSLLSATPNNNSVSFNAAQLEYARSNAFAFNTGTTWSLEVWIKPTDLTAKRQPISLAGVAGSNEICGVQIETSGAVTFFYFSSGSYRTISSAGGIIQANTVNHVVITFSVGNVKIYVNNTLVKTDNVSGMNTWNHSNTYLYGATGRNQGGAIDSTNEWWYGHLDEIALYPSALTQTQVSQHYSDGRLAIANNLKAYWRANESSGTDVNDFLGTYPATLISGVTFGSGKFGNALVGSTTSRVTANTPVSGVLDVSWSFWIKGNAPGDGFNRPIIQQRDSTANGYQNNYIISTNNTGKILFWDYYNTTNALLYSNTNVMNNSWHHVVVTRSANICKIYIDGALDATQNTPQTINYDASRAFAMLYDRRDDSYHLNATIDDIAIWQPRTLSLGEVQDIYTRGLANKALLEI